MNRTSLHHVTGKQNLRVKPNNLPATPINVLFYQNCFIDIKLVMFICEHISKLIAYALSVTNNIIDVAMRVPVYPVVDSTRFDVICKFNSECAVQRTSSKLRSTQSIRWYMMCNNYFMLGITQSDGILDKS